jgi:hypothetical protein
MIMFKESDVLNKDFRAKVIEEILGNENKTRKAEHFKRYEVYHDRVAKYTEDLLLSQFDKSTVNEMKISMTNVSLCRKIVDKLARVYSAGVDRLLPSKRDQKKLDLLEKQLCFQSKMKKANRYLELHNNIWVTCLPKPNKDALGNVQSYSLKLSILPPFLFDVIEDYDDRESAKCLIISNYDPGNNVVMYDSPERNGRRGYNQVGINSFQDGDGKDQIIADTPLDYDPKNQRYKWWTNTYHFVTSQSGEIIDGPEGLLNPIGIIPGVALNKDQDGQYYSVGGSDLVDSCLLSNAMLTNQNHIAIQQGYGQAYMIGKDLPQNIRLGPTKVIKMEQSADGERSEFGFATANAPLAEMKELLTTQIALLLSTNNLSTSGVKVDLSKGADFPSGIAMMIDKSESTEDVMDQAQLFIDAEPSLLEVVMRWLSLYQDKGLLDEKLKDFNIDIKDLQIKIHDPKPIESEGEKLENLKKRKELGISTMIDLIKLDNPQMTDAEAEKKLLQITEEKQKAMLTMAAAMGGDEEQEGEEDEEKPKPGFPEKEDEDEEELDD